MIKGMNRIGVKIVVMMSLLCLIPLLVVGVVINSIAGGKLLERIEDSNIQMLGLVESGLIEYFDGVGQLLDMAGNYRIIKVAKDNIGIVEYLESVARTREDIQSVHYALVDKTMLVYPAVQLPDGYDPTVRPWFLNAKAAGGKVVLSAPYVDPVGGGLTVTLSKSIVVNGEFKGVVAIDCSLDTVSRSIVSKNIGGTGRVVLVDSNGIIVMHPEKEMIGENIGESHPIFKASRTTNRGFLQFANFRGEQKFGTYTKNQENGWVLFSTVDVSILTEDSSLVWFVTFVVIGVTIVIVLVVASLFSRSMSRATSSLVGFLKGAAEGNFAKGCDVARNDEFGILASSCNDMSAQISSLVEGVRGKSDRLSSSTHSFSTKLQAVSQAIEGVSHEVEDIAKGAVDQEDNTGVAYNNVNDLDNQLVEVGVAFDELNGLFSQAEGLGSSGVETMVSLGKQSDLAIESARKLTQAVEAMKQATSEVGSISETLSGITSQTNLLSLNASIEAARAGDSGRGFSVVADEVRKLAEQSKVQTDRIDTILDSLKDTISAVEVSSDENRSLAEGLVGVVSKTKSAFESIIEAIRTMGECTNRITAIAARSGATGESLSKVVSNVVRVAESNVQSTATVMASVEEINSTIDELNVLMQSLTVLADELQSDFNRFTVRE